MDQVVNTIVGDSDSLVCLGATDFSPNAPIKGHIRTPGLTKITTFLKKKSKCDVLLVDEYRTSQTCGKCLKPLDRQLHKMIERHRYRYRICTNCGADATEIDPATTIITDKSKRKIRRERTAQAQVQQIDEIRLSKKIGIVQTNQYNFRHDHVLYTVWNRDICAARVILHKGKNRNNYAKKLIRKCNLLNCVFVGICMLTGHPIGDWLSRQRAA